MTRTAIALKVINENDVYSPRRFAELFWPNHEGWHRHGRIGRGTTHGVGMMLAGGAFLGKLQKQGLVKMRLESRFSQYDACSYHLTDEGKTRLRQELPK